MARRDSSLTLVLALTGVLLASASRPARACVCGTIEPDAAYQHAALIFTGTVEKITDLAREVTQDDKHPLAFGGRIMRFTVEEYFKGTGGTEVEIHSANSSCDINFEAGKRYLVYASRTEKAGEFGASSCSRTGPLGDFAKPDISYLRRAARGERPTMLYGFAFKNPEDSAKRGEPAALDDLTVIVEGVGKRLELKTDARGYFETFDLPPGSYRIHTGVTGKLRGAEAQAVELAGGGVASIIFRTTTRGSLSGLVVDQMGRPVSELQVELLQAKSGQGAGGVTDYVSTMEDGRFVFQEVTAGQYVLAVNSVGRRSLYGAPFLPSYFPNAASSADAQAVTIADGVSVELGAFVLQGRYPTVAVSGVVITPDGKPVPGAYIYLEKRGGEWDAGRTVQTDDAGRFVHQAFEGLTYTLRANADGPNGVSLESDAVEATAAKNARPLRIVVKPGGM